MKTFISLLCVVDVSFRYSFGRVSKALTSTAHRLQTRLTPPAPQGLNSVHFLKAVGPHCDGQFAVEFHNIN
jgi:hypothetical protein